PISVSDVDIAESNGTFTVIVSRTVGSVTLSATSFGTAKVNGALAPVSGVASITITEGNAADTNLVLNSIQFTTVTNQFAAETITVSTNDNGGTGTLPGGVQPVLSTIAITITAVNDAPVVTTVAAPAAYSENSPAVLINAVTVSDVDSADFVTGTVSVA